MSVPNVKINPKDESGSEKRIVEQPTNETNADSERKKDQSNEPPSVPSSSGGPLGLDLLANVSKIKVKLKHQTMMMPSIMAFATYSNSISFDIFNGENKRIYAAAEESDNRADNCCGALEQPFKISIVDFSGRVVLELNRECNKVLCLINCGFCCCCLCGRIGGGITKVKLSDGSHLGTIKHSLFRCCFTPSYKVYNSIGKKVIVIKGLGCGDCCIKEGLMGKNPKFTVKIQKTNLVGKIWKKEIPAKGAIVKDDNLCDVCEAEIPLELDVDMKALFLSAIFVLNFMYFDHGSQEFENKEAENLLVEKNSQDMKKYELTLGY